MTTEEKAKAWDEAIERAKSKIRNDKDHVLYEEDILDIFPSLKESDEERIRKEIIEDYRSAKRLCREGEEGSKRILDEKIAWLEKQGEHSNFLSKIQIGDKVTRNEDGVLVNLSQLNRVAKKKGEQKPAESNDIEGILLVHDEILNNLLERYKTSATFKTLIVNLKNWWNNTRRHLLSFNIEQKSAWSEEDGKMARFIGNAITADDASTYLKDKGIEVIDAHVWLESLKDRVLPQLKQEWREEDETKLNDAIDACKAQYGNMSYTADWLLSIKERFTWKPSDEQMERLKGTINSLPHQEVLYSLYQDLKKLKG